MALRTRFTLQFKPYVGAGTDSHGNTIKTFGAPADWPVYGYVSGANTSPYDPNREHLSQVLWTVYAPVTGLPDGMDRVTLGGTDYDIDGDPRDYSHDPFGHSVGQAVIYLKKAEG